MIFKLFFCLVGLSTTFVVATGPRLVPAKRNGAIDRRSFSKRDISPRDNVVLTYATTPYHPVSATISLIAQDDRPIVMVADFEHLLGDITCTNAHSDTLGDAIVLDFLEDAIYLAALREWTRLEDFAVITAHPGCNLEDEHGAWIVRSVMGSTTKQLTLLGDPVAMRDIVRSFGVNYNHNGAGVWGGERVKGLSPRSEDGFNRNFSFGYNPNLESRLPLFPPNLTLDNSVPEDIIGKLTDAEIDITCVNCNLTTNVTVGMNFEVDFGDVSCIANANQSCFTLNNAAMNFTIEQFEQDIALEVFIGKEIQSGANYKVLWIPVAPALNIPSLVDLGPAVGVEIAFELDITQSINFTFEATGIVPQGAFASVSLVNSTGGWDPVTSSSEWSGSSVVQTPLRINSGQFNVSASVALAPYAEIQFTILDVGAALRIIENVPKASVNSALQTLVNRECKPVGEDDFESFGTAFLVESGLTISTEAQLVLEKGSFAGDDIPDKWDFSVWTHDIPFVPTPGINQTTCFVLSSDALTLNITNDIHLPGQPATTGTLLAVASAIPTWNMSKIESYYSANGALPTSVNYTLMLAATSVPADLQSAVTAAVSSQTSAASSSTPTRKSSSSAISVKSFAVTCRPSWLGFSVLSVMLFAF